MMKIPQAQTPSLPSDSWISVHSHHWLLGKLYIPGEVNVTTAIPFSEVMIALSEEVLQLKLSSPPSGS